MKRLLIAFPILVALAAGCAAPSREGAIRWIVVDEENGIVEAVVDPDERPVGQFPGIDDRDVSDAANLVVFGQERRPPARPRALTAPGRVRMDVRYRWIAEVSELISRSDGRPELYELRARLWEQLGWRRRAQRDLSIARFLRDEY
jgi:hypothetical protein